MKIYNKKDKREADVSETKAKQLVNRGDHAWEYVKDDSKSRNKSNDSDTDKKVVSGSVDREKIKQE